MRDRENWLLRNHGHFNEVSRVDREAFIALARAADFGQSSVGQRFVVSENTLLKWTNEDLFESKALPTAITNYIKQLQMEKIWRDPQVQAQVVGIFEDYKGLQAAVKDPAIVARIKKLHQEVNAEAARFLQPIFDDWTRRRGLPSFDVRRLFVMAEEENTTIASWMARDGRKPGRASFRARNEAAARTTQRLRKWVQGRFSGAMVVEDEGGRKVLSSALIDLLRKSFGRNGGGAEKARQRVWREFGERLSANEASLLWNYVRSADFFSPNLLQPERVVIRMDQEGEEILSVDFRAQNSRNLEETMKALARAEGGGILERAAEVRRGEEAATRALEAKKQRFRRALQRVVPGALSSFTGDDGIAFLASAFSDKQWREFRLALQQEGQGPGELRLVRASTKYADSGAEIPAPERSKMIVMAESAEKRLRERLSAMIPRAEIPGLQIDLRVRVRERGESSLLIGLETERPLPAGLHKWILAAVKELGYRVEIVEFSVRTNPGGRGLFRSPPPERSPIPPAPLGGS